MGMDYFLMVELLKQYGPKLEELFETDYDKFKALYNETKASFEASMKLSSGKPTPEAINRRFALDMMATVNGKKKLERYFATSKDDIALFLRGEEKEEA